MASYIQGLTDYVPQIQPFKPDLNFYNQVLQQKQSAYDKAQSKLSNIYGTLLYSPLTRQENIKRRDDFFKMIEQDIKKVSAMDLSLPQNQETALSVFDPLIEDKEITHDMGFTKAVANEMEKAESYRLCVDPKKCGGSFWEAGVTALQMKLQDYGKASKNDALSMNVPRYTPFINVTEKALQWAKDMDLVVEAVSNTGQYIVKKQNGDALAAPLLQMYTAVFGNDPAVIDMYNTSAYLNRKEYIFQNKEKYGGDEDKAEDAYFIEVMNGTIKNLEKDAEDNKDLASKTKTKTETIRNKIKRDGISIGDPLFDDFRNSVEDENISTEVTTYYERLNDMVKTLPNISKDRRAMRGMIENIVAQGYLKEDLTKSAYLWSVTHNNITGIEANPYAMASYQSSLNIKEKMVQHNLDVEKAIKLAEIEIGKEMALNFANGGFPDDYEGTPEAPGAGSSTAAGGVDMYAATQGERTKAGQNMFRKQNEYINNTVSFLMSEASNSNGDPASRQFAKNELKAMLGQHYDEKTNSLVNGNIKTVNYSELNFGPKNVAQLYNNAKIVVDKNKNLYKNLYARNAPISEQYDQFNIARSAYSEIIQKNNASIKAAGQASTDINRNDKFFFDKLFVKMADGKYNVITNENDYVNSMMNVQISGYSKPSQKQKFLREKYQDMMGVYKEMYSGGKVPGIKSPYGMGLGANPDGGVTANPVSWSIDYTQPAKFGNQALISFYRNAMLAGDGAYKVLMGANHTGGEYADAEYSSASGKTLFNAFVSDLNSGRFLTKEQKFKAPSAKITYSDVAANSGNLVSVTLSNINPEWLKSKATGKEGQKVVFGMKLEDAINNGVTMYLDKNNADNVLTNQYKMKAGDVYLNSGLTYSISRPNAGKVSLRKTANSIVAEGVLFGYDVNGTKQSVNITSNFDPTLSGDALIKNYTQLFNEQEQLNINFLESGALPKFRDEASLMRYYSQQGMSPGGQASSQVINSFRSSLGF